MSAQDIFYKCVTCFQKFPSEATLLKHVQNLHVSLCEVCGKSEDDFKTRKLYLSHCKAHKGKSLPCDQCNNFLASETRLQDHFFKRHSENKFTCDQCSEEFIFQTGLVRHKKMMHLDEKVGCQTCSEKFRKDYIIKHEKICSYRKYKKEMREKNKNVKKHLKFHMFLLVTNAIQIQYYYFDSTPVF